MTATSPGPQQLIPILDWPLLSGPVPPLLLAAAFGAAVWLLWGLRSASLVAVTLPCAAAAAAATVLTAYLARRVWQLFPDPLEPPVYCWIAAAMFAVALMVHRVAHDRSWWRATVSVLAMLLVVVAAANQINRHFAAYPVLRDALGIDRANEMRFTDLPSAPARAPAGHPLDTVWQPPATLPATGRLTSAPIPGTVSAFTARPAEIYLPPAYFADPRPALPVLVLLAGEPGGPRDWVTAGRLAGVMDSFAAAHRGLAPVVVVADGTGSFFGNPLCLDSRRGNAATYLAVDVPAWVTTHLTVDGDPSTWAVGGFSYGGTCALQLATNYPTVYLTFLDLSGSAEPSLGDRRATIDAAFGGDRAAFTRVNPLDVLRTRHYDRSAGAVVVGAGDDDGQPDARTVVQATRAAGMDVHQTQVTGRHDWNAARSGLTQELPWLANRMGLTS